MNSQSFAWACLAGVVEMGTRHVENKKGSIGSSFDPAIVFVELKQGLGMNITVIEVSAGTICGCGREIGSPGI
jgi:hypothetical protein